MRMENWLTSLCASGSDKVLPESFFERKTLEVAIDLLGKLLVVRSTLGQNTVGRIVETEGYFGGDPASHSARGKTPRSSVMFGPPSKAYVYFIYGMYEMLNFVTEPQGIPGAVLIRAVEPVFGESWMIKRRKVKGRMALTSGPGKLTQAMGVRMSHNGESLQGPTFYVVDDGFRPRKISASGRVGISQAQHQPWRYFITGHPFVSRAPQNSKSKVIKK